MWERPTTHNPDRVGRLTRTMQKDHRRNTGVGWKDGDQRETRSLKFPPTSWKAAGLRSGKARRAQDHGTERASNTHPLREIFTHAMHAYSAGTSVIFTVTKKA
jgi:hypothetical protein